jgi:DNA-binding GntR family transcriptional regulator
MGNIVSINEAPHTIRASVEKRLRDAIVNNRFPPGMHLSDRALCEEFGASRNIIREVIRGLEAEGLVTVFPNRGPFVSIVTVGEAVQIYELRGALEALAGEGFAVRASDAERAALEAVFVSLCTAEGPHELVALKAEFYEILLRGCRNHFVDGTLRQFLNRISQLRATSMSVPGRLADTIRELRKIMQAIRNRDAEGAGHACREHVRAAAHVAIALLRESERDMDIS